MKCTVNSNKALKVGLYQLLCKIVFANTLYFDQCYSYCMPFDLQITPSVYNGHVP